MLLDRRRIREEAIDRDQSRKRREEGEERIEGHTGRDRHDPIVLELLVDTPQDVLPAAGRNGSWRPCPPAASRLLGLTGVGVLLLSNAGFPGDAETFAGRSLAIGADQQLQERPSHDHGSHGREGGAIGWLGIRGRLQGQFPHKGVRARERR